MTPKKWIEQNLIPLTIITREAFTKNKQEIEQLKAELKDKNWILEKSHIDLAIAQQVNTYLQEQNNLLKIRIEQLEQINP